MKRQFLTVLLLFGALCIGFSQEKPVFSAKDVFQLEYAADPQISPNGRFVVYARTGYDIMKDRKQSRLWLVNNDGKGHQKLTAKDVNESGARWSSDGTRIAFVSSSDQGAEIYVYWVNTGKVARLTQLERSPRNLSWSNDGTQIAFTMKVPEKSPMIVKPLKAPKGAKWADPPRVTTRLKHETDGAGFIEPGYSHIFVIPSEGGTARQITSGDFNHRGPAQWTKGDKALIISGNRNSNWEYEFRNSEIYSVSIADGKINALTNRNGPDYNPVVSPDGEMIAYLGFEDKIQTYQLTKLYTMDINGKNKKEVDLALDRSVSSPAWDAFGTGLFFKYDDEGNTKIGYANPGEVGHKKMADNVGGTSLGRPYGGGSFSVSSDNVLVYTHTTPEHPSDIALASFTGKRIEMLTDLNKDLLPHRELGAVEEIWYKSTVDQRDVQGWIVKPPYYDAKRKYPLIVENHGGPISNYGDRFSPEIQLLAAAGYVVFYPNPRGSTSYGEEFGNLLYHNYPGEDYNDVMDGVDAVIKKGYVSEDSLFVTGGSAGGIMTAWMIGKNNRFRAAAVIKPVMNWVSKTLTADNYYGYSFYRYPDWPWENIETYMKFSPISLVGNVETPTLVMVGTADLRTPLSEAKQLYHALKLRKIDTALVEVPGASHFIAARPSQLVTKIAHILAWFEAYK